MTITYKGNTYTVYDIRTFISEVYFPFSPNGGDYNTWLDTVNQMTIDLTNTTDEQFSSGNEWFDWSCDGQRTVRVTI